MLKEAQICLKTQITVQNHSKTGMENLRLQSSQQPELCVEQQGALWNDQSG